MKVFLINMDNATDRLAFMQEQLGRNGIEFERVPGVNGKLLDQAFVRRISNAFLQFCVQGKRLTRGEIGCALSHIGIWKRIVDENISCACILEDDVTVLDNIKASLEKLQKIAIETDNAAYLISAGVDGGADGVGILPGRGSGHMCGYVVTRASAEFLIKCNTPIVYPCDAWPVWEKWGIKFYKLMPRSVAHWNRKIFGSMNDGERVHSSSKLMSMVRL